MNYEAYLIDKNNCEGQRQSAMLDYILIAVKKWEAKGGRLPKEWDVVRDREVIASWNKMIRKAKREFAYLYKHNPLKIWEALRPQGEKKE